MVKLAKVAETIVAHVKFAKLKALNLSLSSPYIQRLKTLGFTATFYNFKTPCYKGFNNYEFVSTKKGFLYEITWG
jgi:hypothetical protein